MRANSIFLTIGMNNLPVRICKTVSETLTGISNACPDCKGDIGHKNYCKGCGKIHDDSSQLLKGYKVSDTEKIILNDEQLAQLNDFEKIIEAIGIFPKDKLDIRTQTGCYYILPAKESKTKKLANAVNRMKKQYAGLAKALEQASYVLVVKFTQREKQRLGYLTVKDQAIVLVSMAYYEDFKRLDESIELDSVSAEQVAEVDKFIKSALKEIDTATIENEKIQKLEELLKGKPMLVTTTGQEEVESSDKPLFS